MKEILRGLYNVWFRRILYKIPFKFLLLLLWIGAILFASCNADYFSSYWNYIDNEWKVSTNDTNLNNTTYITLFNYNNWKYTWAWTYCIKIISTNPIQMSVWFSNSQNTAPNNLYTIYNDQYNTWICLYWNKPYFNAKLNSSSNTVHLELFKLDNFLSSPYICNIDFMWVEQDWWYTDYNVLFDSNTMNITNNYNWTFTISNNIDSNYCENNNLCPVYTWECENSSGVNWSSLYINDIQHIWWPNIYIGIPEEISRDYDYIDEDMYINVSGYNVDYDKITWIINTQNYKPSTEDFNYIVSSVIPLFVPWLVIILFLYWIFRFIKKIF